MLGPRAPWVGTFNAAAAVETVWRLFKKSHIETPTRPSDSTWGHMPQRTEGRDLKRYYSGLFTRAQTWKQPECPLMDG